MGIDYAEIEREICRIPEISAARIVTNDDGIPVEVHILASPTKQAKQVVRDVQSVALAAFGVELDRRVISVVQLEGSNLLLTSAPEAPAERLSAAAPEPPDGPAPESAAPAAPAPTAAPAPPAPPAPATQAAAPAPAAPAAPTTSPAPGPSSRPTTAARPAAPTVAPTLRVAAPVAARVGLGAVQAVRLGRRCRAEVSLRRGGSEVTGSAEGLYAESAVLRLVAEATIAALRQLDPEADRADVEAAAVFQIGSRQVAMVAVVLVDTPGEEVCTGSALLQVAGATDAVARATLDALNRRLARPR